MNIFNSYIDSLGRSKIIKIQLKTTIFQAPFDLCILLKTDLGHGRQDDQATERQAQSLSELQETPAPVLHLSYQFGHAQWRTFE